ncbi:MAG: nucleotidyltransferase domain-containing protein [Candidatus Coatesbacteria bacterium]|nr:nucleotidyltransferase domain-containing protein [Candidatus Coatesbacteria bacterium]
MQTDVITAESIEGIALSFADSVPVSKIILYGSRATDEAGPDSDIDLLVIEKDVPETRRERNRLRSLLPPDLPVWVDIWVMSEERFEEEKDVIGSLAYPANKFGRVVYEKP